METLQATAADTSSFFDEGWENSSRELPPDVRKIIDAADADEQKPIVVIKVGTDVISPENTLDLDVVRRLVTEIAAIRSHFRPILVVSGAVAKGREAYGIGKRDFESNLLKQKLASAGQDELIAAFKEHLKGKGLMGNQVLLTHRDFASIDSRIHLHLLLKYLLQSHAGSVPIINENDAVSTEELEHVRSFTDNDELAGLITLMLKAPQLVMVSKADGLREDVDVPDTRIVHVDPEDRSWEKHISTKPNGNGRGGMRSKMEVSCLVAQHRERVRIVGMHDRVLQRLLLEGEKLGTEISRRD